MKKIIIRLPEDCDRGNSALEDLIGDLPIVDCEDGIMEMEAKIEDEMEAENLIANIRQAIVSWKYKK